MHQKIRLVLVLVKQATFCLSLQYNADNSYLFVNGKEIFNFKADKKMLTFQFSFVSDIFLMDLVLVSLKKHH